MDFDVVIVGAGLAGLCAAANINRSSRVLILDDPLEAANGASGGFARFSGAKFSLPPAGQGLVSVAGGQSALMEVTNEVLSQLGLSSTGTASSLDYRATETDHTFELRRYESIVLTPKGIDSLIEKLRLSLGEDRRVVYGRCESIERMESGFELRIAIQGSFRELTATKVVLAGGRQLGNLALRAGAIPQVGKGTDVGVRVEFESLKPLSALRALGPDAKILMENARTFCLNVPGEIYSYRWRDIQIPGGIVADRNCLKSNVGLLLRIQDRNRVFERAVKFAADAVRHPIRSIGPPNLKTWQEAIGFLSSTEQAKIVKFGALLGAKGLIEWNNPYLIHFPLLDWHWDVFAKPSSFETTIANLYAIGDLSGHARGLLQAAVSGYLAGKSLNG